MLGGSGLAGGGTGTSHVGFRRCFLCVYLASHSWWSVTRRSSLLYRDVLPIVRMDTGLKSFDTKGLMQSGRRPPWTPAKASVMSGFIDSWHITVPAKISKHSTSITFLISLHVDHEEEQKGTEMRPLSTIASCV